MVRSFLNAFEKVLNRKDAETPRKENVRTHPSAMRPRSQLPTDNRPLPTGYGTILTGEMFAPTLSEQVDRYNRQRGTRLNVLAVPNTYFGRDVSVAGLLTGQDYLKVKDKIVGDFAIIPKHTIKSDEPILLDGMTFDKLKAAFPVPIYDLDTNGLIALLS